MTAKPIIEAFFDKPTNTISYLIADPATRVAAVIDPVQGLAYRPGFGNARPRGSSFRRALY